tara:strand:- start:5688 stop:7370 length:1683 start_codon:yes stop_codon:yes gene_type:complete
MQIAEEIKSTLNIKNKKKLGAFYTPYSLCTILSKWAIQSCDKKVIEPSFGECSFIEASFNRLKELECSNPEENIYGCDIDPNAFSFLTNNLNDKVKIENFILKDFMHTAIEDFDQKSFDVSVGNPPYISSHNLTIEEKNVYLQRWKDLGIKIDGRASLWAHFLIHAIQLISIEGRLAWVLPGSLLQADYAIEVRKYLSSVFEDVICISMEERFFLQEGTEEETVILLAKNKIAAGAEKLLCFAKASSIEELEKIIENWDSNNWSGKHVNARPAYLYSEDSTVNLYNNLCDNNEVIELGNLLSIKLGVVTGDNSFFVINEEKKKAFGIRLNYLKHILSRTKYAKGINYTISEHIDNIKSGLPGYLIHVKNRLEGSAINDYLNLMTEENIASNRTFSKRKVWHAPDDSKIPDAFLSPMNNHGPKMVLNSGAITCTNTIYRANFLDKSISSTMKKIIAISLLTSFSQLSAEFTGRKYGSGILKHEPSEMKKIKIVIPTTVSEEKVDIYFSRIDFALRANNIEDAMCIADELILSSLENGKILSRIFKQELISARSRRRRSKRD